MRKPLTALLILLLVPQLVSSLPIVPGGHGFGMETPAGSGRNLMGQAPGLYLSQNLIGSWDFDDQSASDSSGNGHHGTLQGDASMVPRGSGYALSLDGNGDYVDLSDPGGYLGTNHDFTVSAWAYNNEVGGCVVCNSQPGGYWQLWHNTGFGGKWVFDITDSFGTRSYTAYHDHRTVGKWRQLVGVYNSSEGRASFYLNGKFIHGGFYNVDSPTATQSTNLAIGSTRNMDFNGTIDDVMLFDRALSPEEIFNLYALQAPSYFPDYTQVYRVTNLNDAGPGSLREGIDDQESERTIVFEVSGNIDLQSPVTMNPWNSYLTIAGQTAPDPGITLKNYGFNINQDTHDILVQHIRIRPGDTSVGDTLHDGWIDEDGSGSGTVYSHHLNVSPDVHYSAGSVWWNWEKLNHSDGMASNVPYGSWDWDGNADRIYVNVGSDPSTGKLTYGVAKEAISDPFTLVDSCGTFSPPQYIVVDHCSISWGGDMNTQSGAKNYTFSYNLNYEALNHPWHPKGPHSKGFLQKDDSWEGCEGGYLSFLNNVLAHNADRNPLTSSGEVVVANNVLYDAGAGISTDDHALASNRILASIAANYIIETASSSMYIKGGVKDGTRIYISPDNFFSGWIQPEPWKSEGFTSFSMRRAFNEVGSDVPLWARASSPPVWPVGYVAMPALEVRDHVLSSAGARPVSRDPVDTRLVNEIQNDLTPDGAYIQCITCENRDCIDHEVPFKCCTGWETGTCPDRYWPDLAENTQSLSLPQDHHQIQPSGYTLLEEWIHGYSCQVEGPGSPSCPSTCGDSQCSGGEDCSTCPADCTCSGNKACCSGFCVEPLCNMDQDCGSDPCFTYTCHSPGTCSSYCSSSFDKGCDASLCEGLDLLFHFDEDVSRNEAQNFLYDWSGGGSVAGCKNTECPTISAGRFGKAYSFDGTDDIMGTNFYFEGASEMTLSLWYYYPSSGGGGLIGSYSEPITIKINHPIRGNEITIASDTTNENCRVNGLPSRSDQWTNIIIRFNTTHCVVDTLGERHSGATLYQEPMTNPALRLGKSNDAWADYFMGSVDELSVWDRYLTDQEIQDIGLQTEPIHCRIHRADQNLDLCIQQPEMLDFVDLWHSDSTEYLMHELMEGIALWKSGQGCS